MAGFEISIVVVGVEISIPTMDGRIRDLDRGGGVGRPSAWPRSLISIDVLQIVAFA
jgi:hypothetical protein